MTAPSTPVTSPAPTHGAARGMACFEESWSRSPERAAWIARCTRAVRDPTGRIVRVVPPRAQHVPQLVQRLVEGWGPVPGAWSAGVIRSAARACIDRCGAGAVVEVAEWLRFVARLRRLPVLARLAVEFEIAGWVRGARRAAQAPGPTGQDTPVPPRPQ